ncbi:MAG: hypothetical protein IJW17_13965, partial [Lentisphaeria bacterium]|nr:hypothetical protein [Lentisphaeria bacterium]
MKKLLGIDLGTTKVAAVITDENGKLLAAANAAHNAGSPDSAGRALQGVPQILDCVRKVVCE